VARRAQCARYSVVCRIAAVDPFITARFPAVMNISAASAARCGHAGHLRGFILVEPGEHMVRQVASIVAAANPDP
jgi:hypothetical protein